MDFENNSQNNFENNQSTKWGDFLTIDGMNDKEFFYEVARNIELTLASSRTVSSNSSFKSMKDFYERAKNCNDNEEFREKVEQQKVEQKATEWRPKIRINISISKSVPSFNPKRIERK